MHHTIKLIAACALLAGASGSFATYRCEVGGRVSYQQAPCGAGQQARQITTAPASGWGHQGGPNRHYYPARTYRRHTGHEAYNYRPPRTNPYTSRSGQCPTSHEVHNAAVSASSISLTPYERARQQDNVRMMESCR